METANIINLIVIVMTNEKRRRRRRRRRRNYFLLVLSRPLNRRLSLPRQIFSL